MSIIASLAAVLAAALPAAGVPPRIAECSAAVRDQPTLDLPGATFTVEPRPFVWPSDTYLLVGTETATLKSGARLQVTLAGCEAYSNSYQFKVEDRASLKDSGYWLEKAAQLMGEVEAISSDVPVDFTAVKRDLHSQAQMSPRHDFEAGPLRVREGGLLEPNYELSVQRSPTGAIVTVDYWVPL